MPDYPSEQYNNEQTRHKVIIQNAWLYPISQDLQNQLNNALNLNEIELKKFNNYLVDIINHEIEIYQKFNK